MPPANREGGVTQAATFGAASYGALAINLVQSVLLFRILGPDRMGVWLVMLLIFDYGQHYHLGVINSVNRQLPLRMGRGDEDGARSYAERGAGLLWLLTLAWIPVALVVSWIFFDSYLWGALVVSAAAAFEVWLQFGLTLLKTHGRFGWVGSLGLTRSSFNLAALPLVVAFGLGGAYVRLASVTAAVLLVAWRLAPYRPRPRWQPPFAEFFRDGFPLLAVGLVFTFQINVNRMLIPASLGTESLGQYGLAHMVLTMLILAAGVIGITSYPTMLREYAAAGHAATLRRRVLRQTGFLLGLGIVVGVGAVLLLPTLVTWLLSAYTPGIPAALWILPGVVALSSAVPSSYFLQTIRHQRQHLVASLGGLGLQVALVTWALRAGYGIKGVAMATSAAYVAYGIVLFVFFLVGTRHIAPDTDRDL